VLVVVNGVLMKISRSLLKFISVSLLLNVLLCGTSSADNKYIYDLQKNHLFKYLTITGWGTHKYATGYPPVLGEELSRRTSGPYNVGRTKRELPLEVRKLIIAEFSREIKELISVVENAEIKFSKGLCNPERNLEKLEPVLFKHSVFTCKKELLRYFHEIKSTLSNIERTVGEDEYEFTSWIYLGTFLLSSDKKNLSQALKSLAIEGYIGDKEDWDNVNVSLALYELDESKYPGFEDGIFDHYSDYGAGIMERIVFPHFEPFNF